MPEGSLAVTKFVELQRVWLRYGDENGTLALRGTTLAVERGEFVAVVGPSGCGKSSLMKVVTGTVAAERRFGEGGRRAGHGAAELRRHGVPEPHAPALAHEPRQRDAAAGDRAAAQQAPPPNRAAYEAKALELLALVGLAGFERIFPWQLSGGMQQRAQLCRALIHEPSLLMLDEPFGALDMFTREELWVSLQDLWMARRPTVMLVTHDLREAVFLADRVLVISPRPGRIVAERRIELPRPRTPEMVFGSEFAALVHELRGHIGASRAAA